jgi:hypothetical protein
VGKPKYPGSGQVLRIPAEGLGAYDSVVSYFVLMAYPMPTERAKCIEFSQALKALRHKLYIKGGGDRARVPDFYRQYKNEMIDGRVRQGFRRVIARLEAASMALCIYFSGVRVPYNSPTTSGSVGVDIKAPGTVNKAAEDLLRHTRPDLLRLSQKQANCATDSAITNIKHRMVRPGFPDQMSEVIIAMLHDTRWLRQTLEDAEDLRLNLPSRIPTFKAEEAIQLLPAEAPSVSPAL